MKSTDAWFAELDEIRRWLLACPLTTVHSFDLFDTVVTRIWARPSDLFLALGQNLARGGMTTLSPVEFANARRIAEAAARDAHESRETNLEEIYECFARQTATPLGAAAAIAEAEIAMETASIQPIAAMVELINELAARGRRVVLTSDTYFSSGDLAVMLAGTGLDLSRIGLFLSSEHRASKKRVSLYAVIRRSYSAPAFTHLGDRKTADYENARAAGFDSRLFVGQAPNRRELALGGNQRMAPVVASALLGSARAARLRKRPADMRTAAIRTVGASVAGPLLAAFVAFVLRSAADAGVKRLLFLARDGQILHQMAKRIAPAMGVAVDCRYAYASRRALYLPSVRAVGDAPWSWLAAKVEGRTVDQVLERFGLDRGDAGELGLSDAHLSQILDSALAADIRHRLQAPAIADRILCEAARRRALARRYFSEEIGTERSAIVDLGWKGRLQVCIERILDPETGDGHSSIDGYYFALDGLAATRPRGARAAFAAYRSISNPVLLECFALADHGTLLGFRHGAGDSIEPVLARPDMSTLDWGVAEQQAAIMEFVDFFLTAADLADLDIGAALAALEAPALRSFMHFVRSPSLGEATVYGDLLHSDDQAHHGESPIAPVPALTNLVAVGLRRGAGRGGRRVSYWPQASLKRFAETNRSLASAVGLVAGGRAVADTGIAALRRAKRVFRLQRQAYSRSR